MANFLAKKVAHWLLQRFNFGKSWEIDMLTPELTRAARALLDWTQDQLAQKSNLGLSTVKDFEAGRRTPAVNNLAGIQTALENAGIRFVVDPLSGRSSVGRAAHGDFGAVVADPGWPAGVRRV
jgi:DNA-binding XRE family transcriptional regulator